MIVYILKRLIIAIPIIFSITILAFLLGYLSPGDPARAVLERHEYMQEHITEEMVALKRHEMGLDKPFILQYINWLSNVLKGDLGESMIDGRKIAPVLLEQIPCTLILAFSSLFVSLFLGVILGILVAENRNNCLEAFFNFITTLSMSIPGFWLALMLMSFFSVKYHLLPTSGYENFKSLIMPIIVLSLGAVGSTARLMRASVLKEKNKLYVMVARAKGLSERFIMYHHILRNAILPVITLNSNRFAGILGGAVIVENIFSLPGIGSYVLTSISNRDYYVVQAFVMYMGMVYILTNLLTDIIYYSINPQMQLKEE